MSKMSSYRALWVLQIPSGLAQASLIPETTSPWHPQESGGEGVNTGIYWVRTGLCLAACQTLFSRG
jgi:hypothetical protein